MHYVPKLQAWYHEIPKSGSSMEPRTPKQTPLLPAEIMALIESNIADCRHCATIHATQLRQMWVHKKRGKLRHDIRAL